MNNSLQNLQEAETPHMETFSNSQFSSYRPVKKNIKKTDTRNERYFPKSKEREGEAHFLLSGV